MSCVPDFSKLALAPAPEQFEDVRAEPWLTPEGIGVAPVYRASDIAGLDCLDGFPGIAPYLRGPYPAMYAERPWTIRQYAGYSSAEEFERVLPLQSRRRAKGAFGRFRPSDTSWL